MSSTFPVPASLQDLEREPYNLLPYPEDFADDDEASRAESFDDLVRVLERGNRTLVNNGAGLFEATEEDYDPWNDNERIQALYTLVRKSSSLATSTKKALIDCLCRAVVSLSNVLSSVATSSTANTSDETSTKVHSVMSQEFRDAFTCHIYMLFSVMFLTESEAKVANSMSDGRRTDSKGDAAETVALRSICARSMLSAAKAMSENRSFLWQRGVPDEAVAILPCRISFQMLESATGVAARKAASADSALSMIAFTVDSSDNMMGTVVAALMDLLHSYEHIAPMVAELCTMVSENPTNKLAIELIREIGRLNPSSGSYGGKSNGIRNVAPFIAELASLRPRIVLANISHLLPHLNSEPYGIRSSIVTAIGNIIVQSNTGSGIHDDGADESQQVTENPTRNIGLLNSRNSLLDVLYERAHDVSSYTRGAVLKAWINIVQTGSLPLDRLMPVTSLAIDRLQDKTVMVRRSSMQLLTTLLENNPFLGSLDPQPYRKKLSELYVEVMNSLPEDLNNAHEDAIADAEGDKATITQLQEATLRAAIAQAEGLDSSSDLTNEQQHFRTTVQALKFSQSALDFIDQFEHGNEAFQGMLLSANTSDVTEALRFFVKARHFSLPCAVTGMKQALSLMWASEQSIRDEVLKAFVEVFIVVPGTDGKKSLPDNQIAQNLLSLVGRASVSEIASIEEALARLVREERIPADVFLILWSIAAKASGPARAAAMLVLSMGASADRSIVDSASRLRLLLEESIGDVTKERRDWHTVRSAALALQRVNAAKVEPGSAKAIVLELISERLCVIIRGDWCQDDHPDDTLGWFSAAEQCITALFNICTCPETECAEVIRTMICTTFGANGDNGASTCHSLRLARFFFAIGHIALKLLVYSESISGAVRRANAKKTLKKQEQADKAKASKNKKGEEDEEDGIEAQLGVAAEIEAENERRAADISENEILGRGLIKNFSPLLIRVVGNEGGKFSSGTLRQSAALALCKFMCISSSFCEENLPLLFTALMRAPEHDTTLRANIVVALGDIAFRFPNETEPYTPRLYERLRDSSTKVRRHTLMVLTHLILNDMVKVKGQVCEIAMCLCDEDLRIRDMSRLLFHELSKRSNNPIYNLLPDIISQLSHQSLKREDFRNIMSFLLGFIKKEKQNEMLVEKLCQRFSKCDTISQKGDLSYCLAQLKVNEKSIKCLNDNFKLYKDALFDEDVKKSMFSIVTKVKKNGKPELKEHIEEWEGKLQEQVEQSEANHEAGKNALRAKAKARRKKTTTRSQRGGRNRRRASYDDEGDSEEEEEGEFDEDDEEEEETEKENRSTNVSKKRPSSSRRSKRGASRGGSVLVQEEVNS